jgi:O-succinylbenzoic acid--CoA ligase
MKVWFNNKKYEGSDFFKNKDLVQKFYFLKPLFEFTNFWFSETQIWVAKTSGSTGIPKNIEISKNQMEASAKASLLFFDFEKKNDGLILCLSASHVGGFMVLVRAILGDLDLWILEPSSKPIPFSSEILKKRKWFVSMVPLQFASFIKEQENIISSFKGILLGGAPIQDSNELNLKSLQCPVYQSYGMTETVSHIAIRNIYKPKNVIDIKSQPFVILPGIEIRQNEQNCLKVKGAVTNQEWIQTNDLVKILDEKSFFFLGRVDDVINSGGLKINPIEIKSLLETVLFKQVLEFQILGIADQNLGEKVVLAFEINGNPEFQSEQFWPLVFEKLAEQIDSRLLPRSVFGLHQLPKTDNMKFDKPKLRLLIKDSRPIWEK